MTLLLLMPSSSVPLMFVPGPEPGKNHHRREPRKEKETTWIKNAFILVLLFGLSHTSIVAQETHLQVLEIGLCQKAVQHVVGVEIRSHNQAGIVQSERKSGQRLSAGRIGISHREKAGSDFR